MPNKYPSPVAMRLAPALIHPNPFRNEKLFPHDKEAIAEIAYSMRQHGDFGTGMARPVYDAKGKILHYERAMGHRRHAAAVLAGLERIEVFIKDMDDDEMIALMARENGTQLGQSSAAIQNDVYAVTKRLAEVLLTDEDLGTVVPRWPKIALAFSNQKSFDTARGMLCRGNGCGEDIISRYLGEGDPKNCPWPKRAIEEAVATLKETGLLTDIIGELHREIQEPEVKEKIAKARKHSAEQNPRIYDERCSKVFELTKDQKAFRDAVTSDAASKVLPVKEQLALAKHIAAEAEKSDSTTGPNFIRTLVRDRVHQKIKEDPTLTKGEKAKLNYNDTHTLMNGDIKQVVNGLRMVTSGCDKILIKINEFPKLVNHALLGEFSRMIPLTMKLLQEVLNRTDTACFVIEGTDDESTPPKQIH